MERLHSVRRTYVDLQGVEHELEYILWQNGGSYAISVLDSLGYGDHAEDITTCPQRGEALFRLMVEHLVTPISFREILEDFI